MHWQVMWITAHVTLIQGLNTTLCEWQYDIATKGQIKETVEVEKYSLF